MCIPRDRWGRHVGDFTMGPLPEENTLDQINQVAHAILADCQELTDEQKRAVEEFGEERKRQLEAEPVRGLRPSPSVGWQCPNCGSAHSPDVHSCPEPPKGGSLRERLKMAQS